MTALLERALRALLSPQTLTILGSAIGTALAVGLWKRWRRREPEWIEDDRREHNWYGPE